MVRMVKKTYFKARMSKRTRERLKWSNNQGLQLIKKPPKGIILFQMLKFLILMKMIACVRVVVA